MLRLITQSCFSEDVEQVIGPNKFQRTQAFNATLERIFLKPLEEEVHEDLLKSLNLYIHGVFREEK